MLNGSAPAEEATQAAMRIRAVVAALFVALSTCSAATAARNAPSRWPTREEHNFIVGCDATSGGATAYCRCELRWFERRYTYSRIASIYLHDTKQLQAAILRAAAACVKYAP